MHFALKKHLHIALAMIGYRLFGGNNNHWIFLS